MSSQEQPAAKLLSIQEIGWLEVGETRVFLCDAWGGFFTLREQLAREVGGEFQADIFYRAGFAATERLIAYCLTHGFLSPDDLSLRRALGILTTGGYGAFDLVESRFGDGWAVVTCRNTVESSMVRHNGGVPGFVCDYTRGLLRGLMQHLHPVYTDSDPIECAEITCVANGDAECRFIVGTRTAMTEQGYRPGSREFVTVRETLLRLNRQLEDVLDAAQKDPLTGLYNRAYFESALRRRIEFAHRRTDTLAVALIDVDRFKEVNDTQGHGMGDLALQQIARLLSSQGRETDVIARYGGDEFALLMPGTSVESALVVSERVRGLVESQNIAGIPLTLSIGVAACPADATTLTALIDLADDAMYRAKDAGGNAVRRYTRNNGVPTALPSAPAPTTGLTEPRRRVEDRRSASAPPTLTVAPQATAIPREASGRRAAKRRRRTSP